MEEDNRYQNIEPWTKEGIAEAVKRILLEISVPLFDSMVKQLDHFSDLRETLERILYQGQQISFSPAEKSINMGMMFGFLKEENGRVAIANRIFEMYLLNDMWVHSPPLGAQANFNRIEKRDTM